jgi:hypothetical protein
MEKDFTFAFFVRLGNEVIFFARQVIQTRAHFNFLTVRDKHPRASPFYNPPLPFSFELTLSLHTFQSISLFIMIFPKIILAVATLISAHVSAHVEQLSTEHKKYVARSAEAMGSCLESRDLKDFHAQIAAQRSETVQHIRKARGIDLSSCTLCLLDLA